MTRKKYGCTILSLLLSAAMLGTAMAPYDSLGTEEFASFGYTASAADYNWGNYLKKSADWFASAEAISLANTIVQYQLSDGGWRKAMDDTSQTGSWAKSTIDNEATTSQIRVLARVYQKTGNQTYLNACLKGVDLLLNGQYANGGWPQVFNDAGTYHAHITFNDGAMVRVLNIMLEISQKTGDFPFVDDTRAGRAKNAVEKGVQCILDMQIVQNGVKTAWCQQHDEFTLKPAPARAYELPSISASESVGIVEFLKKVVNGRNDIVASINAAITWMDKVKIMGIKVENTGNDRIVVQDPSAGPIWARFYTLDANKPLFVDRDGSIHDTMAELSQERRTGYSWYGSWPKNLVAGGLMGEIKTEITGHYIASIELLDSANSGDWAISQNLAVGSKVFGDRDFTYTYVPETLQGAEYVLSACDSKSYTGELAILKAAEPIKLYVALDTRLSPVPAWIGERGFTQTDMTLAISNDVSFHVYQKAVQAGETITLGSNTTGVNVVGYTVMAQPVPIVYQGELVQDLNLLDRTNGQNWGIAQNLQVGDAVFGDRDFTFTAISEPLLGSEYIRTGCDSKYSSGNLATFVAAKDLTVSVGVDTRIDAPAWLADWTKTDLSCSTSNDVTLAIYQKNVAAGETIILGENGSSANCVNYIVMAAEQKAPEVIEPLKGDVNCDGRIKIEDVVLLSRYVAEDTSISITAEGVVNAECDGMAGLDAGDTAAILMYLAGFIEHL